MKKDVKDDLQSRRYLIDTVTDLYPELGRAKVQDWIGKTLCPAKLVMLGKRERYMFTADELIYLGILTWFSRFGLLHLKDPFLTMYFDEALDPYDDPPETTYLKLKAPEGAIKLCRKYDYQVGISIQARTTEYDGHKISDMFDKAADTRIRRGDSFYEIIYRPTPALRRDIRLWLNRRTPWHMGEHQRFLALMAVEPIRDHVIDRLHIEWTLRQPPYGR